jgi:hypothetical protein
VVERSVYIVGVRRQYMADDSESSRRTGKVERLISAYDLEGIGSELARRWQGVDGERASLRDLAAYFNCRLLEASLDENVVTDVATLYDDLTSDDVGAQSRTRTRLERAGVDVDQLEADFVSHAAVRTYLRHEDVTLPEDDTDQVEAEARHIQRLRTRTATVTQDKLDQLQATDRIDTGDLRVFVDVQVLCEDCGSQYDIDRLLETRNCDCTDP